MRVLMVSPLDPNATGIGLVTHPLVKGLKEEGVVVSGAPLRDGAKKGLEALGGLEFAHAVRAQAQAEAADIIHLQYEPGLVTFSQARALAADPPPNLVVTLHRVAAYNGLWTWDGLRQRKAVWMERALVKAARLLVVHSEHTANVVARRYPKSQVAVQPMPLPEDACSAPRDPDGPILFFGHVHPGKGAVELVRAMKRLPERRCIIAGPEDPNWAKLNATLAGEIAQAPNVTREKGWLSPAMERKHELFRACSAVALPYTVGGFGSAVLQDALAHERPVVASTVEPLASTVTKLGVGAVTTVDVPSLAAALGKTAAESRTPYAEALAAARRGHAPNAIARLLIEMYDALLS